jgi:hypothetical protein
MIQREEGWLKRELSLFRQMDSLSIVDNQSSTALIFVLVDGRGYLFNRLNYGKRFLLDLDNNAELEGRHCPGHNFSL